MPASLAKARVRPTPGNALRCVIASLRLQPMPSSFGSAVTAAAIALVARARTGHAEPHLLIRQTLGSQKCVSQPCVSGRGRLCGLAIASKELGCETDGGAHRDLLVQDRAHGNSNPSHPLGARRPGHAAISGSGAAPRNKCSLIACGSAERSNIRRSLATIAGRRESSRNRTRAISASSSRACVTWMAPISPSISMTRLYAPPSTNSTPEPARAARKLRIKGQS
jgi:hypothetical protein